MTLLHSSVAFKVYVPAFLPQALYFTFLDSFMWMLIFISLLTIEIIAWPAASCNSLRMKLEHDNELYVMYSFLFLLVFMVGAMCFIARRIHILIELAVKRRVISASFLKDTAPSRTQSMAVGQAAKVHAL